MNSEGTLSIKKHSRFDKCMMPPSPSVIAALKSEFDRSGERSLKKFLKKSGLEPGYNPVGKDDPVRPNAKSLKMGRIEMERINVPDFKPRGEVNALVLLIDFDDNEATMSPDHYKDLLFSKDTFMTGSLRDYYDTISNGRVNIVGKVSGWHRMPEKYSFYVGNDSGGDGAGYPHNAKRMVEDVAKIALEKDESIEWDKYDLNGDGMIDALFVVHSGVGAEAQQSAEKRKSNIWSHKWIVEKPVEVTPNTKVTIYLTVPEDGLLGVYAHESGHLIFGWPDLYDACNGPDRTAGLGLWSLMAAGSWTDAGRTPAYPDGWCRMVQGWTSVTKIDSNRNINLKAIEGFDEVIMIPVKGKIKEYFILECRKKLKYDKFIPGEGLLIYHIDEGAENNCEENHLAVGLIQADGQKDLQRIGLFSNQGDDGDSYPGRSNRTHLDSDGFPNSRDYTGNDTKINIKNIKWNENEVQADINVE